MRKITIQGASENNLKNVNVEIPLQKITSVIGVSGSGKSSLIYKVIAAESHRREKIDSGRAECRDYAIRPKFTKIENLPYSVVVKQRGIQQSHSSTLATVTGLHELLRDEFVKEGKVICSCGTEVIAPTFDNIINFLEKNHKSKSVHLFAVVVHEKYADCENQISFLKNINIPEVIILSSYNEKPTIKKVNGLKILNKNYCNTIKISLGDFSNSDCLKKAFEAYKEIALDNFEIFVSNKIYNFKCDYICASCHTLYYPITSTLLSFNSTTKKKISGVCQACDGQGEVKTLNYDELIILGKTLKEHFLNLEHNGSCYKHTFLCDDSFRKFCKLNSIDINLTFADLNNGEVEKVKYYIEGKLISKSHPKISKFINIKSCHVCNGSRLNYKANAVKLYGYSISDLTAKTVDELFVFFENHKLHHRKFLSILNSLSRASVGYLTLERSTTTFSGGELQRIKLANQLNENYKNLLYILDEPSIGLHAYDNQKFIGLIHSLKQQGNTVIISEHNSEYIKNSDYFIELGGGGGVNGGNVVAYGDIKDYDFTTVEINRNFRPIDLNNAIYLTNVCCNNVKNQNFVIPLNALVTVSGVSGSGKSTLIHKVLTPLIKQYILDGSINTTYVSSVKNIDKITSIIELDQSQIGINSRSVIVTYIGIFDKLRLLFSNTESASLFDLSPSAFSFNSEEGQCEYCLGFGEKEDSICPSCLGERYMPHILEVKYKNLSIADVLSLTIDEAKLFFFEDSMLLSMFTTLTDIGLGHLTLGRTTPTLSGGEGQRLKLAKSLIESKYKIQKGNFIFILDEPTTGLSYKDIGKLFSVFDDILNKNNSIIVIEHNLNIIKQSDYIIDIGVGAGILGGNNLFSGGYKALLDHPLSMTAKAFQGGKSYAPSSFRVDKNNLQEKIYHKEAVSRNNNNCQDMYLNGTAFEIEKYFSKNYKINGDDGNFKFFKSKDELFLFVNERKVGFFNYIFNPFVTELFIYNRVALNDAKTKLQRLFSFGFDAILIRGLNYSIKKDLKKIISDNLWDIRVVAKDAEQAYSYGSGWFSVIANDNTLIELSTRPISINHKIIGSPKITPATFNRFLNPCKECYGDTTLLYLDDNLVIKNKKLSILDGDFFYDYIALIIKSTMRLDIKPAIKKFMEENLFDFSKPFNRFNDEERNIFLHGYIHKKFIKQNGDKNTKGDYISWKGLYFYIRENLSHIEKLAGKRIFESIHPKPCPFCSGTGFNNELKLFDFRGSSFEENLKP